MQAKRKFLPWIAVAFGAFVGLTMCPGCSAEYAVPGGTTTFNFTRPDGTRVQFVGNKDTSADSIAFDPATGRLQIQKLNTNGSTLAQYQSAFSINQTNQTAVVILGVVNALQQAGLTLVQNPLTGQMQVAPIAPPVPPTPATQPTSSLIPSERSVVLHALGLAAGG